MGPHSPRRGQAGTPRPEAQAGYSNAMPYGPISEEALDVDEDVLPYLPRAPENEAKRATIVDSACWTENYDEVPSTPGGGSARR